jgi:uncharacterized protein YuzE
MEKEIKIWYDKEADFLEVIFEKQTGYFKETENDAVMEKVDDKGNILGFSIQKVSNSPYARICKNKEKELSS